MWAMTGVIQVALALVLAPLMLSGINRTKALFAGRHGQPWLQPYRDLWKLVQKSAVYSHTTTPIFAAGPILGGAAMLLALLFVPLAGSPSLISFPGDFVLVACLLGLARFFTVSAALDTGSSFEGMGASREVFFSAITEPALLLVLTTLAVVSRQSNLSGMYAGVGSAVAASAVGAALFVLAVAMLIVFLAENARIPVDDPNTHLELTMIHEVMILDHSGPDLALIHYAASLKMWIMGCLLVGIVIPLRTGWFVVDLAAGLFGLAVLAVVAGTIESVMARLRLLRVPQLLTAASVLTIVALIVVMR